MNSKKALLLCAAAAFAFAVQHRAAAATNGLKYTTVAFDGQPAPGTTGVFSGFNELVGMGIGNGGNLYFYAGVLGSGINGTWAGTAGNLTNVFRSDRNAPGVDGAVAEAVTGSINSQGQYLFEAYLQPPIAYNRDDVLWYGTPGNLQVVAREGDVAPGTESTTVYGVPLSDGSGANFQSIQLNDLSQITFISPLRGPSLPQIEGGLWTGESGQLQLIARTNHQVPGLPAGVNFLGFDRVQNPFGTLALTAELTGAGVTAANERGVWINNGSGLQLVARGGDPAPGIAGATFRSDTDPIDHKGIDSSGRLLIRSSVAGPGINTTNNVGYWYGTPGNLNLLFRTGQSIPEFAGTIQEMDVELLAPDKFLADIRFTGTGITAANDSALFEGSATQLKLIAREGMQAPGEAPGVQIGDVLYGITSSFVPNSSGQLALRFTLTGAGVTTSNEAAYYMADADANLLKVVRERDLFDIGGGVMKIVTFPNANLGFPTAGTFNEAGQFLFALDFSDNTHGMFVAQVVPEPSSYHIAAAGLLLGLLFNRKQWSSCIRRRSERTVA